MTVAMTHATCRIVYECFVEILECRGLCVERNPPDHAWSGGFLLVGYSHS